MSLANIRDTDDNLYGAARTPYADCCISYGGTGNYDPLCFSNLPHNVIGRIQMLRTNEKLALQRHYAAHSAFTRELKSLIRIERYEFLNLVLISGRFTQSIISDLLLWSLLLVCGVLLFHRFEFLLEICT